LCYCHYSLTKCSWLQCCVVIVVTVMSHCVCGCVAPHGVVMLWGVVVHCVQSLFVGGGLLSFMGGGSLVSVCSHCLWGEGGGQRASLSPWVVVVVLFCCLCCMVMLSHHHHLLLLLVVVSCHCGGMTWPWLLSLVMVMGNLGSFRTDLYPRPYIYPYPLHGLGWFWGMGWGFMGVRGVRNSLMVDRRVVWRGDVQRQCAEAMCRHVRGNVQNDM
jgi:hypothetical protein